MFEFLNGLRDKISKRKPKLPDDDFEFIEKPDMADIDESETYDDESSEDNDYETDSGNDEDWENTTFDEPESLNSNEYDNHDTDMSDEAGDTDDAKPKRSMRKIFIGIFLAASTVLLIGLIGYICTNVLGTPDTSVAQKKLDTQENTMLSVEVVSKPQIQNTPSRQFVANPFVNLAELRSAATSHNANGSLPAIYGNGMANLPAVPRPNVSPIPQAPIAMPPSPSGGKWPGVKPTVNGIISGENGAVAIMGDGTVLQTGDTYRGDRRVTFIGGDGIEFDNGESIEIKKQERVEK